MSAETATGLSPAQIVQYKTDGYTIFRGTVFSPEKFARLKGIFEECLAAGNSTGMEMNHLRDGRLLEFLLADEVLDLVEPVIGPDIGVWASQFLSKEPYRGKATPWHEDSAFWVGRASTIAGMCAVWLALDESTEENGCLRVIPSSQHGGFSEYEPVLDRDGFVLPRQIKTGTVDETQAVALEMRPNQCSLHDARIIHGARANTSAKRRAAYTLRYFPTTTRVYQEKNPGHKLWLARGVDRAGNRYEKG
jgi:ectoine hydroxylase-related dioxygenase (phytanoyl-CoA dioxygenase family)